MPTPTYKATKITISRNPPTSITAWHFICNALDPSTSPPTPVSCQGELTNASDAEDLSVVETAIDDAFQAEGLETVDWTL